MKQVVRIPSVCVNDCGFTVDAGSLGIDWSTVGVKTGAARASGTSINPVRHSPDPTEGNRALLSYTNRSCRDQIVEFYGYVPWFRMRVGPGNIWVRRFQLLHAINAWPERHPPGQDAAALRAMWHRNNPAGSYNEITAPVLTTAPFHRVAPGDTLNIRFTYFWQSYTYTRHDVNRTHYPYLAIRYKAYPAS